MCVCVCVCVCCLCARCLSVFDCLQVAAILLPLFVRSSSSIPLPSPLPLNTHTGELQRLRRNQRQTEIWNFVRSSVVERIRALPSLAAVVAEAERDVDSGLITPGLASDRILDAYHDDVAVAPGDS